VIETGQRTNPGVKATIRVRGLAADVVGLYMAPPENAIVICVYEKPSIEALERLQGYFKVPNGRASTGRSHDYSATARSLCLPPSRWRPAKITAAHKTRRRRIDLDIVNDGTIALPLTRTPL
jgi:hypothetical protein